LNKLNAVKLQSQAFQHFECFSLTGLYYDGTEPETLKNKL